MNRHVGTIACVSIVSLALTLTLTLIAGGNFAAQAASVTCPDDGASFCTTTGDIIPPDHSGNELTVKEGTTGSIYGGKDEQQSSGFVRSRENKLTVQGTSIDDTIDVGGGIFGGYASLSGIIPEGDLSESTGNTVTIEYVVNHDDFNSGSGFSAVGGMASIQNNGSANAINNRITITEMTAVQSIVGGYAERISRPSYSAEGSSLVSGNHVVISDSEMQFGTTLGTVSGGIAMILPDYGAGGSSTVTDSHVTISSSDFTGGVVNINPGDPQSPNVIGTFVRGGYIELKTQFVDSRRLILTKNIVRIESAELRLAEIVGGHIVVNKHKSSMDISENEVHIGDDTKVTGNVFGGLYTLSDTSGYVTGDGIDIVTENKVFLYGAVVGIFADDDFVEITGGVYGGYVSHDPTSQAKGNEVHFLGDPDTTANSVRFVDAGGTIFIEGGNNSIAGFTSSENGKTSRAWDVEISGGVTQFDSHLAVFETMKMTAGTAAFGDIELGRSSGNDVAPELEVTGGTMTVTGTFTIAGDQTTQGKVNVSGGELIFDGATLATGSTWPAAIEVGDDVDTAKLLFTSHSHVQLESLTVNTGGTVQFGDSGAVFSQAGFLHVNGGELVLNGGVGINHGIFAGLNELSIEEGPEGRPALNMRDGFEVQTEDFTVGDGAWVFMDNGSEVVASHETRVGDEATVDIGVDSILYGGTSVEVGAGGSQCQPVRRPGSAERCRHHPRRRFAG
jgi:hypothetical protein